MASKSFWAYFQLARADFELERFDDALTSAKICLALDPRVESYYNIAICHEALGHTEEALKDFGIALGPESNNALDPKLEKALNAKSKLAPAALARGMLLARLERYSEAKKDFETALKCGSPRSEVYYQMALLSLAQHNPAAAGDLLRESLAEDPSNTAAAALQAKLAAGMR